VHRTRRRSTSRGVWLTAAAAAVLFLVPAADATAAVVRMQVDWAPSDGTTVMTPPYLFAEGNGFSRHQGVCSASQSNCYNAPGTRWQEENQDSGGQPRRISFVDDTTTQYSTYAFSIQHPFANFGPNVVGTATITHANGQTYSVPFDLAPGGGRTPLGSSQGLPPPSGGGGEGGGGGGGLPKPVLGATVVVRAKGELVRIRRPGTSQFVELKGSQSVPVGSVLDTLKGKVKLTSAVNAAGKGQTAHFAGGVFKVTQASTDPLTTLTLVGKLKGCGRRGARLQAAAARWKPKGRRLWGSGAGEFRTRGRRAAATVTGTRWLVADLCDGSTLTRVKSGTVSVRDFVRRRTIALGPGEEYLARPPTRR
jgi:hypothetical protein